MSYLAEILDASEKISDLQGMNEDWIAVLPVLLNDETSAANGDTEGDRKH